MESPERKAGTVMSVLGSVVDVRFNHTCRPSLPFCTRGANRQVIIGVLAQLDSHRVRRQVAVEVFAIARQARIGYP